VSSRRHRASVNDSFGIKNRRPSVYIYLRNDDDDDRCVSSRLTFRNYRKPFALSRRTFIPLSGDFRSK